MVRLLNDDVQAIADKEGEYDTFFQIDISGTDLQFMFERDKYRRLVNFFKLNGNICPETGKARRYVKTHVATANGLKFLVHKNYNGKIVGASAPGCQIIRTENEVQNLKSDPYGGCSKRPRIEPKHT